MTKHMIGSGGGGSSPTNTPDSLYSEDVVEFALALSEGPIKGLQKGAQSFFVGETPLVESDGVTKNFEKFAIGVHPGFPEGSALPLNLHLGGVTSSTTVGVNLTKDTAVTRQTDSVLRGQIDEIEVRIFFSRLLTVNNDGSFANTAHFNVEYKLSAASTWVDFFPSHDVALKGKTTGGAVRELRVSVPRITDDDWVIRVTKRSPDNSTSDIVDMSWESFQCTTKGPAIYPDTAIVHGIGVANGQFSSLPDFSGVYDGLMVSVPTNYNSVLRTYDESTPWNGSFKQDWTNNPAWILYDLIMNTRYGLAAFRPYINTDRYTFYAAAKWCDETVLDGRPRYTFNDIIQDPRPSNELLQYVAGSFNALAVDDNNGTIHLLVDKDDPAVMLFTPENVQDNGTGGFDYSYTDITSRFNDVTVSFINPDLNWNEDRRRIPGVTTNETNIAKYGRIPLEFIAVGCTNAGEAVHKAVVRLTSALTETTMVSFVTTRQGALMTAFDVILIADPTMGWSQSGRVSSHGGGFMNFRDAIYIETIKDYTVKVQTFSGIAEVTVHPEHTGFVNRLFLVTAFPSNVPKFVSFTLEEEGPFGLAKPFRVMSITELEGDGYLYQITAVEINRNKYLDADNLASLPAYQYSFQDPLILAAPTNFLLESGNEQLLLMESGEVVVQILATWGRPSRSRITHFELQWKLSLDETWGEIITTSGGQLFISPVVSGFLYDVRIRSVSPLAGKSDWAQINNYVVVGKTEAPPDIAEFSLKVKADGTRTFTFSTAGQPADVRSGGGYIIRYRSAELPTPWEDMTPLHSGFLTSSPYETNTPRDGIYDIGITAIDSSGNQSANALLISDIIIGDADFLDAKAGTSTAAVAANQLISKLNAAIAAHKAEVAQDAADSATAELDSIASDDVLSKGEKAQVLLDYAAILASKTDIDTKADTFSVSRVSYDTAVAALTTYLGSLSPAYDDATQNTAIDGPAFRSKFVDVYTSRQLLQNGIALAAKTLADAAQTSATAANAAAASAASAAAAAQTDATAANTALANIASDGILSPSEKPSVVQDYNVITTEQSGIDTQATTYSISTEKTAYDSAITALTTYLGTLTGWNVIPGGDVVIVGSTFRTKFSDVYTTKQTLLNKIAAIAKTLADTAQSSANTAQTTANTATSLANAAQSTANAAATSAAAANADLANIAADNILSKGEKPNVVLDYNVIINEKTGIDSQASSLSQSATTYDTAVTALTSYLTGLSPAYTDFTTDTTLVGSTLRTKFSDVYSARQTLLNAITTEATKRAIWGTVTGTGKPADNATVGATIGTNLAGQFTPTNHGTFFQAGAIAADKIQAGTFQTATSGQRVVIDGTTNTLKAYNSSGVELAEIGGTSSSGFIYADLLAGSTATAAIYGQDHAGNYAVFGQTSGGTGIAGQSVTSGVGVHGDSATGFAGDFLVTGLTGTAGVFTTTHSTQTAVFANGLIKTAAYSAGVADAQLNNVIPLAGNTYTLGLSGTPWAGVYSQTAVVVTSDENAKLDIEDCDLGLEFINQLRTISYRIKIASNIVTHEPEQAGPWEPGKRPFPVHILTPEEGKRRHYGFSAQQVKRVLGDKDAAFWVLGDVENPDSSQALRYEELIAPLAKAIQQLSAKMDALEKQISPP